ncbi:MAG TPA: hypothetical protein VNS22_27605 [Geminicoccus sp.]|uniref:hypothetical protein n=1 Tax=Geminicoccus sp. TaxID=2024832 RepID=UPI002C69D616|nr:hypothetical protein [Geminicoccus sp.]HWL72126.1 hypothetical protein [Geminicoccus sp.]
MTIHQRQWLLDRPGLPAERELPDDQYIRHLERVLKTLRKVEQVARKHCRHCLIGEAASIADEIDALATNAGWALTDEEAYLNDPERGLD